MLEDDTFFITEVSLTDSGLQRVAGALADYGGVGAPPGQRGWLRSWVTGWTHRLDVDPLGLPKTEPIAGVGRLAEAVVDVLLERRPLDQMRRWLSRDVVGQLTSPNGLGALGAPLAAPSGPIGTSSVGSGSVASGSVGSAVSERRAPRFASRSMIRSVRLHQPAAGIVESTVVVQDGTRVRAVALRFEQSALVAQGQGAGRQGQARPVGFDWLCTALQFN
jgi:Family of unknown function (DUF6459)